MRREQIRNIAIIAHVDHGKTTLVDKMLSQSGAFKLHETAVDRVMDSNDLEREKGITILAKNTAIIYEGYKINIIDTPGHADFGGEVERIMKMVEGVLLVVDSFESCMPQTRFVLRKALEQNIAPVVVVNKMDRKNARPLEVVDQVLDLFIDLGATDEQLDFPLVYASALQGKASISSSKPGSDLKPLFQAIIDHIPPPRGNGEEPLQMQVSLLDYNDYLGRIAIGQINRGTIKSGTNIALIKRDSSVEHHRISKIYTFNGLSRNEVREASVGDIVAIAGLGAINAGETICDLECLEALPILKIDEPTLQMGFIVNDSPFSGKDGEPVTSRKLGARLFKEMETNVSLRVEETNRPELFLVSGRGELHLTILIENMRREGLEFQVSKPQVIYREIDGVLYEPFENIIVDLPEEYVGTIMEKLGRRRGSLLTMVTTNNYVRLEYSIPTRGLVGFRSEYLTDTRGYGIINASFDTYKPYCGEIQSRRSGVLVAFTPGTTTSYGHLGAEERGILFIEPGTEVYEGMVIGENSREQDLAINICKEKPLNNIRSSTKEHTVKLKTPRSLSLEHTLSYLGEDEYLEVTPKTLRLRKILLNKTERERSEKNKKASSH